MKRSFEIGVLAGGIALLALLAYGRHAIDAAAPPSWFTTYDTGPNGYAGLYAVLSRAGVPVRRFERPLSLISPEIRTLIVSRYAGEPNAKGFRTGDAARLRRFVENGGRLVALDSDFAGADDIAPGVGTSHPVTAREAVALARTQLTAGVARVRAPISAAFGWRQRRGALPLLASDSGIVATQQRIGKGEVVAITSPGLFSNAGLRDADNLSFAYDIIAGHGPAAFDEYVHGYTDGLTLWEALPAPVRAAFWIVCVLAVIATIGAAVPFAPPLPPAACDDRDSSAYVDAMGMLLRRARAGRAVVSACAGDARQRLGRIRHGDRRDAIARELQALEAIRRPSDAEVLRAARLDYALRKESR